MDIDAETAPQEVEQEEEPAPELPPPMKPIQNPAEFVQTNTSGNHSKANDDVEKNRASGFSPIVRGNKEHDLAEIEQIVKEKMVREFFISLLFFFLKNFKFS